MAGMGMGGPMGVMPHGMMGMRPDMMGTLHPHPCHVMHGVWNTVGLNLFAGQGALHKKVAVAGGMMGMGMMPGPDIMAMGMGMGMGMGNPAMLGMSMGYNFDASGTSFTLLPLLNVRRSQSCTTLWAACLQNWRGIRHFLHRGQVWAWPRR